MTINYINGQFVSEEDSKISIYDIGLTRGFGIYEGITTYNNLPFHLEDHYNRLLESAKWLGIEVTITLEQLNNILLELIRQNPFERTDFRLIVTGGKMIDGINFDLKNPTILVIAENHIDLPEEIYVKGTGAILTEFVRENPLYKTLNYVTAVRNQKERIKHGATEIIYYRNNEVSECSTSNIFIVKDGVLITPDKNILMGITRKIVLDIAKNFGIKIETRSISVQELKSADECFATGSFKEIVPIVWIAKNGVENSAENRKIKVKNGLVGPITNEILAQFRNRTKNSIIPAHE